MIRDFKAGVHMNAVFSSLNMDLMLITRSCLKQSKIPLLISRSYVVGYFVIFWGGLVKLREIGNIEDLMKV